MTDLLAPIRQLADRQHPAVGSNADMKREIEKLARGIEKLQRKVNELEAERDDL